MMKSKSSVVPGVGRYAPMSTEYALIEGFLLGKNKEILKI